MTRVVLAISFDETIYLLNRLFVHTGYTPKRTAGNQVKIISIINDVFFLNSFFFIDNCCYTR